MAFLDTNVALKLPKNSKVKVGINDVDKGGGPEKGVNLPFPQDPEATWLYYECVVDCLLDSGIAVHNRLPQVNNAFDSLAAGAIDDPNFGQLTSGVNLRCHDQYADIVQRVGHARYWFRLCGQAMRAGLQVPIPSLKTIGGVPAIPYDKNPQFAFNRIAPGGSYGGVVLWHAGWSLWYTTAVPLTGGAPPSVDLVSGVSNKTQPPKRGVQVPFSLPDDNAVKSVPPIHKGAL